MRSTFFPRNFDKRTAAGVAPCPVSDYAQSRSDRQRDALIELRCMIFGAADMLRQGGVPGYPGKLIDALRAYDNTLIS